MRNQKRKKGFKWYGIWAGAGVCALVAIFFLYRYINLNLWITEDAGLLQPYSRILIKEGKNVMENSAGMPNPNHLIENAVIAANTKDRIVLNLSISDVRYNLFHTKSYVKVFLQTAIPHDRSKTTSIKFLNILVKRDHSWRVQTTQDISIE